MRVAVARQLKDTEMPISAVRGRGSRNRGDLLLEGVGALRVPESNGVGTKVLDAEES